MANPKPVDFTWANGPNAVKTTVSDSRKQNGYVPFVDVPPAGEYNDTLNQVQRWFFFLNGAGTYDDLQVAIEKIAESVVESGVASERTFILDEKDTDLIPGATAADITTAVALLHIAATAKSIIIGSAIAGAAFTGLNRDLTTNSITYTPTGTSAVPVRVLSDGDIVAIAYGDEVEFFTHDTGVSLGVFDHGALIEDIALAGDLCLICGAESTSISVRAITMTTQVALWSYDHGAIVRSITSNGRVAIFWGASSTHGGNHEMRAVTLAAGNDAANEGGTAADTTGAAWDADPAFLTAGGSFMACDGKHFWKAAPFGSFTLERRAIGEDLVLATLNLSAAPTSIDVDQDYIYITIGTTVEARDKLDLGLVWTWIQPSAQAVAAIASDGGAVFVATARGGANDTVFRINRGNRPTLFRRVDTTERGNAYKRLAIPSE